MHDTVYILNERFYLASATSQCFSKTQGSTSWTRTIPVLSSAPDL